MNGQNHRNAALPCLPQRSQGYRRAQSVQMNDIRLDTIHNFAELFGRGSISVTIQ